MRTLFSPPPTPMLVPEPGMSPVDAMLDVLLVRQTIRLFQDLVVAYQPRTIERGTATTIAIPVNERPAITFSGTVHPWELQDHDPVVLRASRAPVKPGP